MGNDVDHLKPRSACSAATAISLLRSRKISRVVDRLTILANICNYSIRINTHDLELTQACLCPCILALSLLNGDDSLLYLHSSREPRWGSLWNSSTVNLQSLRDTGCRHAKAREEKSTQFTWERTLIMGLLHLDDHVLYSSGYNPLHRANRTNLDSLGLRLSGFLWLRANEATQRFRHISNWD
jgi:hypothetical protein